MRCCNPWEKEEENKSKSENQGNWSVQTKHKEGLTLVRNYEKFSIRKKLWNYEKEGWIPPVQSSPGLDAVPQADTNLGARCNHAKLSSFPSRLSVYDSAMCSDKGVTNTNEGNVVLEQYFNTWPAKI